MTLYTARSPSSRAAGRRTSFAPGLLAPARGDDGGHVVGVQAQREAAAAAGLEAADQAEVVRVGEVLVFAVERWFGRALEGGVPEVGAARVGRFEAFDMACEGGLHVRRRYLLELLVLRGCRGAWSDCERGEYRSLMRLGLRC